MVREERQRKSSKKNKPEKIPQRGLGVAQLEQIRCMEEQQRIAGASSSDFSRQGLGFPPPPLATAAFMKPRAASTFFMDHHHHQQQQQQQWQQPPPPPPGFFPMVWNAAVDAKEEASLVRKIGVPLHHMKQPPPPPIASLQANSPTCHRMEPPSNQNNSNNYDLLSCWRSEQNKNSEEMMVCNKRPQPPPPAIHLDEVAVAGNQEAYCPRKHPFLSNECSRATGSNLVRLQFQASRGNTSTPFVNSTSSDLYIDKRIKENCGVHDGNFLSLASVSAPSLTQYDHCDFSLKNAQKNTVNVSSSNELPFYDFFLVAPIRNEKTTMLEIEESPTADIDLNLRL